MRRQKVRSEKAEGERQKAKSTWPKLTGENAELPEEKWGARSGSGLIRGRFSSSPVIRRASRWSDRG